MSYRTPTVAVRPRPMPWSLLMLLIVPCLGLSLAPSAFGKEGNGQPRRFVLGEITIAADFDGAAAAEAVAVDADSVEVRIRPENTPINDSAWYAFRVTAARPQTITVRLTYCGGSHRYHPKLSRDGMAWHPIDKADYQPGRQEAELRLQVGPQPLWVCAQELWNVPRLAKWMEDFARRPEVSRRVVGRSLRGAAIQELAVTGSEAPNVVILLGRQHPPEVTGTLGLMHFAERLMEEDELAAAFRRRFHVLVYPLINPDGVSAGHWRHNVAGVDLNRDWGPFAQPETRAVRDAILHYRDRRGWRPCLLLDFHSTHHDVFYTPPDDGELFPPGFVSEWLARLDERLPDYRVRRAASPAAGRPTAQRWGLQALQIAAVTYELGDHTDRDLIRRTTRAAAEEAMALLLAAVDEAPEPAEALEALGVP